MTGAQKLEQPEAGVLYPESFLRSCELDDQLHEHVELGPGRQRSMRPRRPTLNVFLERAKLTLYSMFEEATGIAQHTVVFVAAIFSIWCVQHFLAYLLGDDAEFYGLIPVRYVVDTGDLAILVRFVWKLVTQIWKESA